MSRYCFVRLSYFIFHPVTPVQYALCIFVLQILVQSIPRYVSHVNARGTPLTAVCRELFHNSLFTVRNFARKYSPIFKIFHCDIQSAINSLRWKLITEYHIPPHLKLSLHYLVKISGTHVTRVYTVVAYVRKKNVKTTQNHLEIFIHHQTKW